jgi:hypothetical protein
MEHSEQIHPQFLGETELPVDPDELTFAEHLFAESQASLNRRLGRNLIDGILDHFQEPYAEQSFHLGYDPKRILELFEQWWTFPADQSYDTSDPDGY